MEVIIGHAFNALISRCDLLIAAIAKEIVATHFHTATFSLIGAFIRSINSMIDNAAANVQVFALDVQLLSSIEPSRICLHSKVNPARDLIISDSSLSRVASLRCDGHGMKVIALMWIIWALLDTFTLII